MARQAKIVLVAPHAPERERLLRSLEAESMSVATLDREVDGQPLSETPDLVLIDAGDTDPLDAVRACRRRWPSLLTPVLVVNVIDSHAGAAAIDAGATDSFGDAAEVPHLTAHIRRMVHASRAMKSVVDAECERVRQESLARAAAAVAKPLEHVVDGLEAIMTDSKPDRRMDELLDRLARAVDAVERLRRQAVPPKTADEA